MTCEDWDDAEAAAPEGPRTPERAGGRRGRNGLLDQAADRVARLLASRAAAASIQMVLPTAVRRALATVCGAAIQALTSAPGRSGPLDPVSGPGSR